MLVYVPATLAMLRKLLSDNEIRPINGTAFAVTPALREAYSVGDDDELAEVAMREAALASLRLLADRAGDDELPPRRVVVVAELDEVTPRPDLDDAVVRVSGTVGLPAVVSAHVDLAQAEGDVRRAAEVIDSADLGDEDAELVVGDAQDHDLAWYAPQELPFLLELL